MGLSRRRPVGGLRLRGASDDGPPTLLPPTIRGLYGWRPGHSDSAGKGMRLQVGEHCVKDTTEEEEHNANDKLHKLQKKAIRIITSSNFLAHSEPIFKQLHLLTSYDIYCPNKHRTNLRPHKPKWKEVCSTSHTKIEGPTSGLERGQNS